MSAAEEGSLVTQVIEKLHKPIVSAQNQNELLAALQLAAEEFGFRSAYLIDYPAGLGGQVRIIDSRSDRDEWWRAYMAGEFAGSRDESMALFRESDVVRLDSAGFLKSLGGRYHDWGKSLDMLYQVSVPIRHGEDLVGMASFCGEPNLDDEQERALQLVAYNLVAQMRNLSAAANGGTRRKLTPRETEVMNLAANGLTSTEIGEELEMSARTVNQHIENVALKLETRNRAHTIAEAIRRGMLA